MLALLGIILGIMAVGGALYWAFRPRPLVKKSPFAPASGDDDPMTAASMPDAWN
jgi:hypothetical protein